MVLSKNVFASSCNLRLENEDLGQDGANLDRIGSVVCTRCLTVIYGFHCYYWIAVLGKV